MVISECHKTNHMILPFFWISLFFCPWHAREFSGDSQTLCEKTLNMSDVILLQKEYQYILCWGEREQLRNLACSTTTLTQAALQFFFFFFCLFAISWPPPVAYGGSQARGPIGVVATGYARATATRDPSHVCNPQLMATPDP